MKYALPSQRKIGLADAWSVDNKLSAIEAIDKLMMAEALQKCLSRFPKIETLWDSRNIEFGVEFEFELDFELKYRKIQKISCEIVILCLSTNLWNTCRKNYKTIQKKRALLTLIG